MNRRTQPAVGGALTMKMRAILPGIMMTLKALLKGMRSNRIIVLYMHIKKGKGFESTSLAIQIQANEQNLGPHLLKARCGVCLGELFSSYYFLRLFPCRFASRFLVASPCFLHHLQQAGHRMTGGIYSGSSRQAMATSA